MVVLPLGAQARWQVSPTATLRIADQGTEETLFQSIPSVVRLPDDRILVAENRSGELRIFRRDGSFERRETRRGNGPNELGPIAFTARTSTEVVAFDGMHLVWYDLKSLRELRRQTGASRSGVRPSGALRNGVIYGTRGPQGRTVTEVQDRVYRDSVEVVLLDPDSETEPISIGRRPGTTFLMIKSESARLGFRGARLRFGNHTFLAASDDVLWFLDSDADQLLRIHGVSGRRDSLTLQSERRAWDEAAIARERARISREFLSPEEQELPLAQLDRRFRAEVPPRWAGLYADIGNGVWVEEFRTEQRAPRICRVLNERGVQIASVEVPPKILFSEIGADYILGTEKDQDGVPSVVRYALQRR
jgi:hypothetical protein